MKSKINVYKLNRAFFIKGHIVLSVITVLTFADNKGCKHKKNEFTWSGSASLNWSQFKGNPVRDTNLSAVSFVQLRIIYSNDYPISKIDVICWFETNKSWTRDNSEWLLNHERGHFNLGEIYARKLRQQYADSGVKNRLSKELAQTIYLEQLGMLKSQQERYDLETIHSLDSNAQHLWDNRIDSCLASLERFKRL